jgi:acyl-CoA thioesterase
VHLPEPVDRADRALADPTEIARRCAEVMYADDLASRHLGIRITDVTPGRAVATMVVTEEMTNGHGICHGGYVFLLADTAFAFACNTYDRVTVTAAADVVFLAPTRLGDELAAEGLERQRFGRSGIYDVTVRRADGSVVAEFRGHSRAIGGSLLSADTGSGEGTRS